MHEPLLTTEDLSNGGTVVDTSCSQLAHHAPIRCRHQRRFHAVAASMLLTIAMVLLLQRSIMTPVHHGDAKPKLQRQQTPLIQQASEQGAPPRRTFTIAGDRFLRDGTPVRLLSGSFHYFRTPHELWPDRIARLRALGLNTIQLYGEQQQQQQQLCHGSSQLPPIPLFSSSPRRRRAATMCSMSRCAPPQLSTPCTAAAAAAPFRFILTTHQCLGTSMRPDRAQLVCCPGLATATWCALFRSRMRRA